MDTQENIPTNMISDKEANTNKNISINNNSSLYPKDSSILKDIDSSVEKHVKERQSKLMQNEMSFNSLSFPDLSKNIVNNQDNLNKEKETEPSLQKVVRVNINELYKNTPTNNEQRVTKIQVPKSLEDWIENHSKKALEEPVISSEKPPSYIPVLETTEDLDEIITPKRSVSCRARNHTSRSIKVMNTSQNLPPQNNNISNNQNNAKKHRSTRQPPMIHLDHDHLQAHRSQGNISLDIDILRRSQIQKGILPKFQMCSYKQCDFIATDRCESCFGPLCLNHLQIFNYTMPLFRRKKLCINCYKKIAKSYLWFYLLTGVFTFVVLIVILLNHDLKIANTVAYYACCSGLGIISLASFLMAYFSSNLLTVSATDLDTF